MRKTAGCVIIRRQPVDDMRILLVDDDVEVTEYVRKGLEEEGYAVAVCRDGAAGLRAAELHAFDVIVLDVMMPFVDGLEVTRRLRRQHIRTADPAPDRAGWLRRKSCGAWTLAPTTTSRSRFASRCCSRGFECARGRRRSRPTHAVCRPYDRYGDARGLAGDTAAQPHPDRVRRSSSASCAPPAGSSPAMP